jgi:two-component system phosphate regulon response regulator PhoB
MSRSVLIVSAGSSYLLELCKELRKAGYKTSIRDETDVEAELRQNEDTVLVLLGIMSPLASSALIRTIRNLSGVGNVPILVVGQHDVEKHKIRALDAGADSYIVEWTSKGEALARVDALIRRTSAYQSHAVLRHDDLEIDTEARLITRGGDRIHLGPSEFRVLQILMEKPGKIHRREELFQKVWGPETSASVRVVDVAISRVRTAMRRQGAPDLIITEWREGYGLRSDYCEVSAPDPSAEEWSEL